MRPSPYAVPLTLRSRRDSRGRTLASTRRRPATGRTAPSVHPWVPNSSYVPGAGPRVDRHGPPQRRADVGRRGVVVRPGAGAPRRDQRGLRPVPGPRAVLAAVQPARPRARRGPEPAAARARPVPGDLLEQPRRVLHGPRGRPQAPDRHRARRPRGLGDDAARDPGDDLEGGRPALAAPGRGVPRPGRAGPAGRGHRAGPVGRPRQGRAAHLQAALQGARLPGAHAPGRRPGAPVPLHLRALAQPGRRGPQPRARRSSTSRGSRSRRTSTGSSRSATTGSCRWRT